MCVNEHLRHRIWVTDRLKRRLQKDLYAGDICCKVCGYEGKSVYIKREAKDVGSFMRVVSEMHYCPNCRNGGKAASTVTGWTALATQVTFAGSVCSSTATIYDGSGTWISV